MPFEDPFIALKELIEAQRQVISSWEKAFGSVEETIVNLIKKNLELKLRFIRQVNPEMEMPEGVFEKMDTVRARYQNGRISPLEYFVFIDTMLTELESD